MIRKPDYQKKSGVLKTLTDKEYNVFRYLFFKLGKEIIPKELPLYIIQKAVSLKKRQIHYIILKLKEKKLLETWACRVPRIDKNSGWRTTTFYRIPRFIIEKDLWKM